MEIPKIKKLIELLEKTDIYEIEIKEGEESLRLTRHPQASVNNSATHAVFQPLQPQTYTSMPAVAAAPQNAHSEPKTASTSSAGHKIRSPMVGTLYLSPSPEAAPFVSIGQSVNIGDTICIVEAMKMFNEIESDRAGKIVDILVKNGDPVEYDQVLFIIE